MKYRVDVLLVERGLVPSRTQAQALILAGRVFLGEQRVDKPGTQMRDDVVLTVRETSRYVSRGGDKLAGAISELNVEVTDAVCVDVGASTGGFTDCLLQAGARRVYAIDVGHAQLADKLRRDPRVINREGENARHLEAGSFPEPIDWLVVDASFIGLEKLVEAFARVLPSGARLLALVKPQFEAGREEVRRGQGVIRDPVVREAAIARVREQVELAGFELLGACDSRVHGPKGNVEHFLLARKR